MVLLPLIEIPLRRFGTGIPGAISVERHLTLWVAFLGAALAAREGRLLSHRLVLYDEGPGSAAFRSVDGDRGLSAGNGTELPLLVPGWSQ